MASFVDDRRSKRGRFELHTSRSRDGWLFRAYGTLDQRSGPHLEDAVTQVAEPNLQIVIDVSGVAKLEGAGLDSILRCARLADEAGATVRMKGRTTRPHEGGAQ